MASAGRSIAGASPTLAQPRHGSLRMGRAVPARAPDLQHVAAAVAPRAAVQLCRGSHSPCWHHNGCSRRWARGEAREIAEPGRSSSPALCRAIAECIFAAADRHSLTGSWPRHVVLRRALDCVAASNAQGLAFPAPQCSRAFDPGWKQITRAWGVVLAPRHRHSWPDGVATDSRRARGNARV